MDQIVAQFGGPGLLIVSFVAATIVPFSSEAALVTMLKLGMPAGEAILWASIGNCLGVTLNYVLGRLGRTAWQRRHHEPDGHGARALRWVDRYGAWSLLLSWAPVVGDPLTIAAGVARVSFVWFALIGYGVRVLRYWALVEAFG